VSITNVAVFFTTNPTKFVLQFSKFSTNFYTFYKFQQVVNTIEVSFCTGDLRSFGCLTGRSSLCMEAPRKIRGFTIGSLGSAGGAGGRIPASPPPLLAGEMSGDDH
jgi:hypothetical protein